MKYLLVLILCAALSSATIAQTGEVGPGDMRYRPQLLNTQFSGSEEHPMRFLGKMGSKPGYVFLASAALPGLGQAANQQWWKTGLFVALEATAIGLYSHKTNKGRSGQRRYQQFANENWSVVAYAKWMVNTYNLDTEGLLKNGNDLSEIEPNWGNTHEDWNIIHIEALRELERQSIYTTGNSFNHSMPDYDSQQYYELVSKYFQYAPGWNDFEDPYNGPINIEIGYFSSNALNHSDIGYHFNNNFRTAGHMMTLLVVNHFVSAFDAYITHMMRNNSIQASASMRNGPEFRLTYNF
ncbi:MAG: DUF5683 domain-containing protein [Balneolales bacterium]